MAVVFCTLSSLFGVYVVLFTIAVWSTYRHNTKVYRDLRLVTVVLFLVLCAHYAARAFSFGRARIENSGRDEESKWTVPLVFVGALTSTVSCLISDGLLAWRFYVIYGRTRLALYLPVTAVTITALLGFSGDFQQLAIFRSVDLYNNHIVMIALDVNAAWGWCTFAVNTILTGSIIGKIISVAYEVHPHRMDGIGYRRYSTALEAIVESALVTWVGLLLYEIATFAPTSGVTANFNIGYIMVCITPIFFGISQCLITARLALKSSETYSTRHTSGDITSGSNYPSARLAGRVAGMTFKVPTTVEAESTWETSVDGRHVEEKGIQSDIMVV